MAAPDGNSANPTEWSPDDAAILRAVKGLYLSRKYGDLTMTAGSEMFPVHKSVVCARSPVIANQCDGPSGESRTHTINTIHDPAALESFLEYLYLGGDTMLARRWVSNEEVRKEEDSSILEEDLPSNAIAIHHVKVYALAAYYDVPDLKDAVKRKFVDVMAVTSPVHFSSIVKEVYSSTPANDRGLRAIVVAYAIQRSPELKDHLDLNNLANFTNHYTWAVTERTNSVGESEKETKGKFEGLASKRKPLAEWEVVEEEKRVKMESDSDSNDVKP